MSDTARYAIAFLLWPGLAGAALLGWLYLWFARKLVARAQGRKGPPFYQPFFDFVKLLGKRSLAPEGASRLAFYALPLASVAALCFALALVPTPGNPLEAFPGDVVLLAFLLEVPALCDVLAGYVSRSIYGQVGAMRESIMTLGYNLPFVASVIALATSAGSFSLRSLGPSASIATRVLAAIAFLLSVPARLKSNPFSIPNAEQEIVSGSHIEYNGAPLAIFELSHALETVLLAGLFVALFVPQPAAPAAAAAVDLAAGAALVALVSLVAATTARLKLDQAFKFYWTWGALASLAALVAAAI